MQERLMDNGDRFKIIGNNEKGTVLQRLPTYRNDVRHYMVKMDNREKYPKVISINAKQTEQIFNEES